MTMDNYAAPSFYSFDKEYYGTLDDIRGLIQTLENSERHGKNFSYLVDAFLK